MIVEWIAISPTGTARRSKQHRTEAPESTKTRCGKVIPKRRNDRDRFQNPHEATADPARACQHCVSSEEQHSAVENGSQGRRYGRPLVNRRLAR